MAVTAAETVETAASPPGHLSTPLKRGVNERRREDSELL
jgi:hypothetical protein